MIYFELGSCMKILIIGGNGLIGTAVKEELKTLNHEVMTASRNQGDLYVDLQDPTSIEKMYQSAPQLDAVICAAGSIKQIQPISTLSIQDYQEAMRFKGFGQINVVLIGQKYLNPYGSFTLTTGILSRGELPNTSAAAVVNNAVEGFVKGAAGELHNHLRINAVSPNVITEALDRYRTIFVGYQGVPLKNVALAYIRAVCGKMNGETIKVL